MSGMIYDGLRKDALHVIAKISKTYYLVECTACGKSFPYSAKSIRDKLRKFYSACNDCAMDSRGKSCVGPRKPDVDRHHEFVLNLMAACEPWRRIE